MQLLRRTSVTMPTISWPADGREGAASSSSCTDAEHVSPTGDEHIGRQRGRRQRRRHAAPGPTWHAGVVGGHAPLAADLVQV